MRWENQQVDREPQDGELLGLGNLTATVRTFPTPQFRGVTFYEVQARSALNRVPEASRVPFRWTVNPYRGCTHACVYCFARKTHTFLDLNAGSDFDTRVVVKVNVAERLRAELARPSWRGEHVALGTNVDPYQRAEGRYRLMRGIIEAFRDAANPFSVLTKGSLILRDLDLLGEASERTDVTVNTSVGFLDEAVWRSVEPGTPAPRKRLDVCRTLNDAGVGCGVLMAPVLPYLTDSPRQLETTVRAVAEAGATHVTPIVLHLRPGAREWFMAWLGREHPSLVGRYRELYEQSAYAPKRYQQRITEQVRELTRRFGVGQGTAAAARRVRRETPVDPVPPDRQLTLL